MPDIASLAVKIDSKDVKRGKLELIEFTKQAEKTEDKTTKATSKMGKSFNAMSIASAAAGSVVVYNFGRMAAASIKFASDLEEADSKFQTVFRGQVSAAQEMADVLNESYGQSKREAREYLAAMQDLLVPMGMGRIAASDLSNEIVKLGTDLGSFNNRKTADVMRDIQGALVGEYETMKKYGTILNVVRVQQKALNMNLAETKDQLTAADKAQAAYQLIVESSADAIGDFNRTSSGYANTTKILDAAWEDFASTLGTKFLPAASATKNFMASILSEATKVITVTEKLEQLQFQAESNRISRELRLAKRGGNAERIEMLMDQMDELNSAQFKKIDERHASEKKQREDFLALKLEDEKKAEEQAIEVQRKGQAARDKINAKAEENRISLNEARFKSILAFAREEDSIEQDRIDSNSRIFSQLIQNAEESEQAVSDLYLNMAYIFESILGDIFGDALRGDLDDFEDYFTNFTNSLSSMWGQMAAKMVMGQMTGARLAGGMSVGSLGVAGVGIAALGAVSTAINSQNEKDEKRFARLEASYVQANQLTGSLLGDLNTKSESSTNALDEILKTDIAGLEISKGMLSALTAVVSNNERVAAGIGRASGGITTPDFMDNRSGITTQWQDDLINAQVQFLTGGIDKILGTGLGSAISNVFGSKKKSLIDSGIQVYSQNMIDLMEGSFSGATFETIKTTKRSLFKKKSSVSTRTGALSGDVSGGLADMLAGIGDALTFGADTYGIALEGMYSRLTIAEQKISLKGKTAEEAAEIIGNFVSMTADSWSETILEGTGLLESYQQAGEGAFETYVRLSNETEFFTASLSAMGIAIADSGVGLVNIGQDILDMAGGVDALSSSLSNFYNNFFTDAEKQLNIQGQMLATFNDLNMIMPETREGFKNIIQALDLTNAADRERFNTLIGLNDTADSYYSSLETAAAATEKAAEEAAAESKRAADSMVSGFQDAIAAIRGESSTADSDFKSTQQALFSALSAAESGDLSQAQALYGNLGSLTGGAEFAKTELEFMRENARNIAALEQLSMISSGGYVTPEMPVIQSSNGNPSITSSVVSSNVTLLAEIKALRQDIVQGNFAIAKNTLATAKILDEWDGIGLPPEREAV